MKIIFDYQIFYLQKYGGISRYFYGLTKHLNELPDCEAKIAAPFHQNEYLKELENSSDCIQINPFLKKLVYNKFVDKRIFVNENSARRACANNKHSILHETYYTHRFKVNAPKVITIHDMIYELLGGNSEAEKEIIQNKKQAILEADRIIAVSENTKKDLLSFYPEVKNKVSVVYHGITQIDTDSVMPFNNTKPYILFVGNRDWYKNFERLLDVYCQSKELHTGFDLICFGGQAFTPKELERINKSNLNSNVKLLNGSDSFLNQLYKGASVLAYLSKYEGFGLPVLEALRFGCPVICSNGSSLPEVAGPFAHLINVDDQQEIENSLKKIVFDQDLDKNFKTQSSEWVNTFSWKKCAEETYKVYLSLLKK